MWFACRVVAHSFIHSFIRSFSLLSVSLITSPQPLPKPVFHTVRSDAYYITFQHPLFSLTSSSSIFTSSSSSSRHSYPSIYSPSIACFRRQFLRKMWTIQLAFLLFILCRITHSSYILSNTSSFLIWSIQLIFSILLQHTNFKTLQVFLIYFLNCPSFSAMQSYTPNVAPIYMSVPVLLYSTFRFSANHRQGVWDSECINFTLNSQVSWRLSVLNRNT
jgi:hypothetical protein